MPLTISNGTVDGEVGTFGSYMPVLVQYELEYPVGLAAWGLCPNN